MSKMPDDMPQVFETNGYDSSKLAYAILSSGMFKKCECSVINKDASDYDETHAFPQDMYIGDAITDKNVGTYSNFLKILGNHVNDTLHCVCALGEADDERIIFLSSGPSTGLIRFLLNINTEFDTSKMFNSLIQKVKENTYPSPKSGTSHPAKN